MASTSLHVLVVEDNSGDARLVREAFQEASGLEPSTLDYRLTVVDRLTSALNALNAGDVDVMLLDLGLPDSQGLETLTRAQAHVSDCPIVVLTCQDDESLGLSAVREGAQDYLTKARFDAASLARSIRHARERKQAERDRVKLARTEAARAEADAQRTALQALFDGALDAMLIADDTGRYVDANAAACTLLGRSREEVLTMTVIDITPSPNRSQVQAAWGEFLRTGRQQGEFALTRPDASVRLVDFRATASMQPGRHLSVLRDVTERHVQEAERAALSARERAALAVAEASRAQFRAVAESLPQILWTARPDGWIDWYNSRWFEYTGLTLAQTEGWAWGPVLHPDDLARGLESWRASVQSGAPFQIEYRFRRASDGAHRWHLGRALAVRDETDQVVKWFGTCTDIDDQKRAERSLRVLAEAGAALSAPLDATTTLQSVARLVVPAMADWSSVYLSDGDTTRLIATVHVDPAREQTLRALFDHQGLAHDDPQAHDTVIRTGTAELSTEISDERRVASARDGHHRALLDELGAGSAMTVPLTVAGRTFGALSFVASTSGRRYGPDDLRLAEELGRRVAVALDNARLFELTQLERRRAEDANRVKDEFLSVASHELRTPLNAILGWARLLRSGSLPEDKRERALEVIERNANVQVKLVEDILDVNRIITGKLRLDVGLVGAAQVAEAAADVVRPAADAKGVRLQLLLDPDAGLLHGDSTRLQQIVWNLLANAVKFTPRGGRVHLRLQREDLHVELVVADTGQGIDPAFIPHVFEPFRQADGTSTRSHGGLGLGLAIVKQLVELHGGRIEAHSEGLGRGATFTVRIPIAPVSEGSRGTPPDGAVSTAPARDRLSCPPQVEGLQVLVVDDEPDARELLQSILTQYKLHVTTVGSAAEAFERLRTVRPDILVSDIGMPQEDGYSLIRRVRSLPAAQGGRTPAIALTAYARMEDRTRALMEGFTNHVSKPVEPQELIAVIAAAVGRHIHARGDDPRA